MIIAFQNDHVFGRPTGWIKGELSPSSREGYMVLTLQSGRRFSMQPGGVYGDRDPGTDQTWEQMKITGNVLAFSPLDEAYGVVFMAL